MFSLRSYWYRSNRRVIYFTQIYVFTSSKITLHRLPYSSHLALLVPTVLPSAAKSLFFLKTGITGLTSSCILHNFMFCQSRVCKSFSSFCPLYIEMSDLPHFYRTRREFCTIYLFRFSYLIATTYLNYFHEESIIFTWNLLQWHWVFVALFNLLSH